MRNGYLLIIGLVILFAVPLIVKTGTCTQPVVSVNPSLKEVQIGDLFDIDITIDSVSHLYGFEIWLSFDKTKLNASAIEYRGFLNEPTNLWNNVTNNTGGYLSFAISSRSPATGKTGGSPPPLITIHFKALSGGFSPLQFVTSKTVLADDQGLAIPHTTVNGTVHIAGGSNHDVAATNLITPKTIVGKGYGCNITVVTENHGAYAETYNITLHVNETEIATKLVTVPIGGVVTVNFTWNTSNYTFGGYTIWAYAWPVPEETFTSDNNYTDGQILVLWPGDVQLAYRKIDMKDVAYIARRFLLPPTDPLWDPNADLNNDGKVDMKDIGTVAKYFGLTY